MAGRHNLTTKDKEKTQSTLSSAKHLSDSPSHPKPVLLVEEFRQPFRALNCV